MPQQVRHFGNQNSGKDTWPGPHRGMQPAVLHRDRFFAEVEHHDHEDKEHHDGAGIDDHLECRDERSAEDVEDHGYRQQRNNQVQQGVDGVQAGDHHYCGQNRHHCRDIERCIHK